MPARPGQKRGDGGLTSTQTKRLEDIVIRDGYGIGMTALHHKLRVEMGADAPRVRKLGDGRGLFPVSKLRAFPSRLLASKMSQHP